MATQVKQLVGDGRREPEAARGVLRVSDDQVYLVALHHVAQVVAYDLTSRAAENVTDKEDLQQYFILPSRIVSLVGRGLFRRF